MPKKAEQLLELEADKHAAIDNEVEDKGEEVGDLIYDLVKGAEHRDPDLWTFLGADPELEMQAFMAVPPMQRNAEWSDAFAAMWTAAFYQTFHEVFGVEYIESVERRNERIAKLTTAMSSDEIVEAGKQGFGKEAIKTARQRRRSVS